MCCRGLHAAFVMLVLAWGFRAAAEDFPQPFDTEKDLSRHRLTPAEAAAGFRAPEGCEVGVFAAEPDVMNPIAVAWDTRGRLWVAENFTYAERTTKFEAGLRDRVIILADTDGDGRMDERTVFSADLERLTGIEVGLGGVWLMCPPRLLFVADRDGDDVPDGPPETMLEGFTIPAENHHNFANGLKFGPDGWLYGRCGASAPGLVSRADAPGAYEVPVRGGIWRYHATSRQFEAVCHGTTNPWGHDWDRHGEGFFINTVNGHLWHIIPGAHFARPHTLAASPLVYEPIDTHADHWHWDTGKTWTDSRSASGEHDRRGGGHAHVGMMIYGGRRWPDEFRGRLFTLNQHGRRVNVDRLERKGSGYVGRHEPDILHAADPWMVGIEVTYSPDGSVYLIDWSDTGECHDHTGVHRNSGRIYRMTYGQPAPTPGPDLQRLDPAALVQSLVDANEWLARAARREFCDRAARGADVDPAIGLLQKTASGNGDPVAQLRALWTLHALGRLPDVVLVAALDDPDEHVRAWGIRLLTDGLPLDTATGVARASQRTLDHDHLDAFVRLALQDPSGLVRLALASSLQRLPVADRPRLAAALLGHEEDGVDHNLPALIWFGLIPLAEQNPTALVELAIEGRIPAVRTWTARRVGEIAKLRPDLLDRLLELGAKSPRDAQADLLAGLATGLAGQRRLPKPAAWDGFVASIVPNSGIEPQVRGVAVVFGDGQALDDLRRLTLDTGADLPLRRRALESLIEAQPADLREVCERLLNVKFLNTTALEGLTRFDDPGIAMSLASAYKKFHPLDRPAVIEALVSRPSFAPALLEMLEKGVVTRGDVSAAQARQIRAFGDPGLTARLATAWGEMRDSPADKLELISRLKQMLTPERLAAAAPTRGRHVFAKHCGACHRLFGAGGEIGPDLTGANRQNIDYLLGNIVDPSAVVTRDFLVTRLVLDDGRVLAGIVSGENEVTLTVQTTQSRQTIAKDDVEIREPTQVSLMPEGLLQQLDEQEIADLVAYLGAESQIHEGSTTPGK